MTFSPRIVILATITWLLAGCDDVSQSIQSVAPVQPQPAAAHHVVFGDPSLQSDIRIEPSNIERDPMGILDVQLNFRSTTEADQYLDAFITFTRDGEFVEKLGPKPVVLKGNLHEALFFNSTQPADDYTITFDFAK